VIVKWDDDSGTGRCGDQMKGWATGPAARPRQPGLTGSVGRPAGLTGAETPPLFLQNYGMHGGDHLQPSVMARLHHHNDWWRNRQPCWPVRYTFSQKEYSPGDYRARNKWGQRKWGQSKININLLW